MTRVSRIKLGAAALATLFTLGTGLAYAAEDAAPTNPPKKAAKKHAVKKPAKAKKPAATPAAPAN